MARRQSELDNADVPNAKRPKLKAVMSDVPSVFRTASLISVVSGEGVDLEAGVSVLGRDTLPGVEEDARVSRKHFEVMWQPLRGKLMIKPLSFNHMCVSRRAAPTVREKLASQDETELCDGDTLFLFGEYHPFGVQISEELPVFGGDSNGGADIGGATMGTLEADLPSAEDMSFVGYVPSSRDGNNGSNDSGGGNDQQGDRAAAFAAADGAGPPTNPLDQRLLNPPSTSDPSLMSFDAYESMLRAKGLASVDQGGNGTVATADEPPTLEGINPEEGLGAEATLEGVADDDEVDPDLDTAPPPGGFSPAAEGDGDDDDGDDDGGGDDGGGGDGGDGDDGSGEGEPAGHELGDGGDAPPGSTEPMSFVPTHVGAGDGNDGDGDGESDDPDADLAPDTGEEADGNEGAPANSTDAKSTTLSMVGDDLETLDDVSAYIESLSHEHVKDLLLGVVSRHHTVVLPTVNAMRAVIDVLAQKDGAG